MNIELLEHAIYKQWYKITYCDIVISKFYTSLQINFAIYVGSQL